jgi:ribosomal protein S18 acetylase RimI-like enzyme
METDEDRPFLASLYASTRAEELAAFGWPPGMQSAFLGQQHEAQHRHYRAVYADAERLIILRDAVAVGRLYLEPRDSTLHLIDISLVPERRGAGLGGAILADLVAQARTLGKAVSLQVEKTNPARRLYERLGFRTTADNGLYDWMERPADV